MNMSFDKNPPKIDIEYIAALRKVIKSTSSELLTEKELNKRIEDIILLEKQMIEMDKQTIKSIKPGRMRKLFAYPLFQYALRKFADYTLNEQKECTIRVGMNSSELEIMLTYGSAFYAKGHIERIGTIPAGDDNFVVVFDTHSHPDCAMPCFSSGDLKAIRVVNSIRMQNGSGVSIVEPDGSIQTLYWLWPEALSKNTMKQINKQITDHYFSELVYRCPSQKTHNMDELINQISNLLRAGNNRKVDSLRRIENELRKYGPACTLFFKHTNGIYVPTEHSVRFLEDCLSRTKEHAAKVNTR